MPDLTSWSARARQHGRRAVGDLTIPDEHFDAATEQQWGILWPMLQSAMGKWRPRMVLDFGCGMGRFTTLLQSSLHRFVVGYEPCPEIAALAAPRFGVSYVREPPPGELDLIFCTYVLGGLEGSDLADACAYISGAMSGMLFLAEQTHPTNPGTANWRFRPEEEYVEMFRAVGVGLRRIGAYSALGNEMGVYEGRR